MATFLQRLLVVVRDHDAQACLLLCLVVGALFVTGAPHGGAFSFPDAPRHALNGAFVLDLASESSVDGATQYAYDYYSKYPALTILFYPPLFYVLLAPFFAVFGVSQETALGVELIFYAVFACGTYFLSRRWLEPGLSFAAALIVCAAPEIAFWGRQVMLEIPAFAVLVWSAFFFVRHIQDKRIADLYFSAALLVVALYIKQPVAFMAPVYAIVLLYQRGRAVFTDKHSYIIAALALIGLAPLVVLNLKFGQFNMQSSVGREGADAARLTLSNWIWYARSLPEQVGWPALIASLVFVGLWLRRRFADRGFDDRGLVFLAAWFVVGYVFFSAIDLKEPRFDVFILAPVGIAAALGCAYALQTRPRAAIAAGVLIGVSTLALTVVTRPVAYVDGYATVVKAVASVAPKNSAIVFSGYRDGSFIFNMRALANRPDLSVVRADKLLLKLAVYRELGVEQKHYTDAQIAALIDAVGAHYVVAQPDFWTDLGQMAALQRVLRSAHFVEVMRFKTPSNYDSQEKELVLYRNLGKVAPRPTEITNEVPFINKVITGAPLSAHPTEDGAPPRKDPVP